MSWSDLRAMCCEKNVFLDVGLSHSFTFFTEFSKAYRLRNKTLIEPASTLFELGRVLRIRVSSITFIREQHCELMKTSESRVELSFGNPCNVCGSESEKKLNCDLPCFEETSTFKPEKVLSHVGVFFCTPVDSFG